MAFDMPFIRKWRNFGLRFVFVAGLIEAILSIVLIICIVALKGPIVGYLIWTMVVSIATSLFLAPITFMARFNNASSRFNSLGKANLHARSAFISTIAGELIWLSIIWILWVSAAGVSGGAINFGVCGLIKNPLGAFYCFGSGAMGLLGWFVWAFFFVYFWTLLILSIMQHTRNNTYVWKQSVADADLFAPKDIPQSASKDVGAGISYPQTTAPGLAMQPTMQSKPSYADSIEDQSMRDPGRYWTPPEAHRQV